MPMLHSNTSETFTTAGVTDAGHDASATFAHLGEMLDRKEIYVYPFALNPEGANPSGAVNFSKVSHAKLTIDYPPASSRVRRGLIRGLRRRRVRRLLQLAADQGWPCSHELPVDSKI